jgi:hypothetical protein
MEEHTHPETVHEHAHWHRVQRADGQRGQAWHMHDHYHPSVTHTHHLDVIREYDWHHLRPHDHTHEQQDRQAA